MLIAKIKPHLSFLILAMGAGGFLVSNIILKQIFTHNDYGLYSIVVTYLSVLYLCGVWGLDEVFIRYSTIKSKNCLETPLFLFKKLIIVIICSGLFGSICFKYMYGMLIPVNFVLLLLSSISIVGLILIFNVLRLNSDFVLSQFVSNAWKFILLLLATVCITNYKLSFMFYLNLLLLLIILVFVSFLIFTLNRISLKCNNEIERKTIIRASLHFLISITLFTFLAFSDRYIIEAKFGVSEFGNYFYLSNIFLAPFSLLQNYVGFKQLIAFKKNFQLKDYHRFSQKTLTLGVFLGAVLFAVPFIFNVDEVLKINYKNDFFVIILLIVSGIVRLFSSSITSAFQIKTNLENLKKFNNYSIIITSIIILIAVFFFHTIEQILISIICIWIARIYLNNKLLTIQLLKD